MTEITKAAGTGAETFKAPITSIDTGSKAGAGALANIAEQGNIKMFADLDPGKYATPDWKTAGGQDIKAFNASLPAETAAIQPKMEASQTPVVEAPQPVPPPVEVTPPVSTEFKQSPLASGTEAPQAQGPKTETTAGQPVVAAPEQTVTPKANETNPPLVTNEAQGFSYAPGMEPGAITPGETTTSPTPEAKVQTTTPTEAEAQSARKQEIQTLEAAKQSGTLSKEQTDRLNVLQKEVKAENEAIQQKLDADWRETAGKGENPAEGLIASMKKDAEINGKPPPSEKDLAELRSFMKDVYAEGGKLNLENKNSAEIRAKFIELGQMEAQIIALKALVKDMKNKEKDMKGKVDALEENYLSEDNPEQRLVKLNTWRTSALQLEGYQLAVNDQAARGRQINIDRRNAAGFIHRKLGTKGLAGNIAFGTRTAIYELSDTFQDITMDPVRNKFGFA